MKICLKLLPDTYDHTLTLWKNLMTLKGQSSRARQEYIGLVTEIGHYFFVDTSWDNILSDKKI